MSIRQLIATLIYKNMSSPEIQGLLTAFGYNPESGDNPIEFLLKNIIKSFVAQYFNATATQKMLDYFEYTPDQGDPIEYLMKKVAEKSDDITEDNEFEEERKMIEELEEENNI